MAVGSAGIGAPGGGGRWCGGRGAIGVSEEDIGMGEGAAGVGEENGGMGEGAAGLGGERRRRVGRRTAPPGKERAGVWRRWVGEVEECGRWFLALRSVVGVMALR